MAKRPQGGGGGAEAGQRGRKGETPGIKGRRWRRRRYRLQDDGEARRAEDKVDGIKRAAARPSVRTHKGPDITTCRRVHDVPFYGRTHTGVSHPVFPSSPASARSFLPVSLRALRRTGIARRVPLTTHALTPAALVPLSDGRGPSSRLLGRYAKLLL